MLAFLLPWLVVAGLAYAAMITTEGQVRYWCRLATTGLEAGEIGALFGLGRDSPDVLLGLRANEGEIKRRSRRGELAQYRYLLFSTHAVKALDMPYVKEPALVLSLVGNQSGEDGFLTASEARNLRLNADVVVLSAGNTNLSGDQTAGEHAWSLAEAFMVAGARSVVGTLWEVEDKASSILTTAFFRHIANGVEPAEALALAKREVRQTPGYSNPFFWASFVLVGEG
jgi:CHAT domain-containing protein